MPRSLDDVYEQLEKINKLLTLLLMKDRTDTTPQVPQVPDVPVFPKTAPFEDGARTCPRCGIPLSSVMGYVCSVYNCPTGLGPITCS